MIANIPMVMPKRDNNVRNLFAASEITANNTLSRISLRSSINTIAISFKIKGIKRQSHALKTLLLFLPLFSKTHTLMRIENALISVFHKDGLGPIVDALKEMGTTIYSTGGTQAFIEERGIAVERVED